MSKRNYKRQFKKQLLQYQNRFRMPDSDCQQKCNVNSANEIFENEADLADCTDNVVPPELSLVQQKPSFVEFQTVARPTALTKRCSGKHCGPFSHKL